MRRFDHERRWRDADVPQLHADWLAEHRHKPAEGPWGDKFRVIRRLLGTGCVIGLIGEWGTGKTQLGVAAIAEAIARDRVARYVKASTLSRRLRCSFGRNATGENEMQIFADLMLPGLLVVDEVGQRDEREWEQHMLADLVDDRYAAKRDTLLISNLTRDVFLACVGKGVEDRICETGGVIVCDWAGFRAPSSPAAKRTETGPDTPPGHGTQQKRF